MNFDQLSYLVALRRTGTVRAAADALSLTPGAVSRGIRRLEEATGKQLVRPLGRGVELTDHGLWLSERGQHIVAELGSLGREIQGRDAPARVFCIATHDVFASWLLAQIRRQYLPGVPLSLRDRWPGEIEEAVASRLSEAGVTFTPVATAGVAHLEVARVSMGIYTAQDAFPTLDIGEVPFAVAAHPIAGAVGPTGPLDGWPTDGPDRNVQFKSSSLEARLELCREGECALALPDFVAAQHNKRLGNAAQLQRRTTEELPQGWSRTVHVVYRPGSSDELVRRIEALRAAVSAFCTV